MTKFSREFRLKLILEGEDEGQSLGASIELSLLYSLYTKI